MADEFHPEGSTWWKASSKDRFDSGPTFSSSGQQNTGHIGSLFGWSPSSTDSISMISSAPDTSSDWNNNQSLLRAEREEMSFQSLLHQESGSSEDPSLEMDPDLYGSPSAILQSALVNNNNFGLSSSPHEVLPPLMTTRPTSPPKQHIGHLQFSNNAPFWNASVDTNSTPSSFGPIISSFQRHQNFPIDEKPKNQLPGACLSSNAGSDQTSSKRNRNETPSPLPAFKVRKEKMGDRITALQQLVSPFGKTDTASVLSEAIEYIKILHEQVNVLSAPYMKRGTSLHHHHQDMNSEGQEEDQDLRSRGLCLVPVASTFPVAHEPTQIEFWSPTFGGPFR